VWKQRNIREGWSQEETPPPDSEPTEPPTCPECGEPLESIDEDAEAIATVYYRGTIIRQWNEEDGCYEHYDSTDWDVVEENDWEEEGRGIFYCPHCGADVTDIVRNLV